ncbi:MAG: integrase [Chloroflexi bacterium]|nr:integrase [Chloroflexota bacterium]
MNYELSKEVRAGKVVNLSLGVSVVDAYLKFIKYRCRHNTWLSYAHDLRVFLNIVQKPVTEVTPRDVLHFIEQERELPIMKQRRNGQNQPSLGVSARTIRRRLSAISGFYEYLRIFSDAAPKANPVPRGLAVRSPFRTNVFTNDGVKPLIKIPSTLPSPLDEQEIMEFLSSLRTQRDKAIVLIMLLGGLRRSEVVSLTLRDIDFGKRVVVVRDGKGGQQRVAAVAGEAFQVLLRYLNKERPPSSSAHLFLVLKGPHRGQPLSAAALDTIIKYHRKQADTPGVRCHRLRHTCLTRLRQAGMSLEALQAQAGHKSITSTRIYLHLCPRELQEEYLRVSHQLINSHLREEPHNE